MFSDGDFEELICALSDDKHFSQEPIVLTSCSHSVCKSCLIKEGKTKIRCEICGITTDRDLRNDKTSAGLKKMIKMCLNSLFSVLEKQMTEQIESFKGIFK
jgi:hypothetical protein